MVAENVAGAKRAFGGQRQPQTRRTIVAIPARNEVERIGRCLSGLAMQRDRVGAPVAAGTFSVVLLVNNSNDGTAETAMQATASLPYGLEVLTVALQDATAGKARRRAMEEAAARLRSGTGESFILTTDADSLVSPTWYDDNLAHLEAGADCVAGYIDAEPAEIVSLGPNFLYRGRLEDHYLRLVAEIYAICDPRPHDPWPTHRVSSGASLAVRLSAYDAVGGMPDQALGEDAAFTAALENAGYKVRHAMDVSVITSCRLEGRAGGGAADTMRLRRDIPDAPCDDNLEPAVTTLYRATLRGILRRAFENSTVEQIIPRLLPLGSAPRSSSATFAATWKDVEEHHPRLQEIPLLRPSDLPSQIAAAKFLLRNLRFNARRKAVQDDKHRDAIRSALAAY